MGDTVSVSNDDNVVLDRKWTERYYEHVKLKSQRVLLIGGGSGIGLATAQASLEAGAEVFLAGRSAERLRDAAQYLGSPERVQVATAELADETSLERLFSTVGSLHHVVVTAIDPVYKPIMEFSRAELERVVHSKLIGPMLVAKHGARRLAGNGSLVFTSGIAAERPAPRGAAVAAANGGLNSLVRALAVELAPLRINAVSPGWTDTPVWDSLFGRVEKTALHARMSSRLPVGRIGQPAEIAQAIVFLLTNQFTTGTVLSVDGGHAAIS